uniref:Man26A n=1 Tax=Cellulomonas fimi TaxID=1708 RepID=Q9XCV5_CELFI|nr:Man26A [Cellulomonas fimi ATCC 484]
MTNRSRPRGRTAGHVLAATAAALALTGLSALPAQSAPAPAAPVAGALPTAPADETIAIVDADATAETRSLLSYLDGVRGEGILFGHQHTTSFGLTTGPTDGTTSDVKNVTGDFPAVFGWDTLIIEGNERPGLAENTRDENIALFADYIRKADAIGGVNTVSAHVENFVTGGSFYDTSGDTLRAVLPGGSHHAELVAYLDDIAELADASRRDDGTLIPIVFRPWHENAGSWFWWGAAYGSPGEYQELYRFTVEYLRDVKGVSNFLYAWGPGGGFGGNRDVYLRTYPGDAFVDVLGLDTYDSTGSDAFLAGLVADLRMIAEIADEKGKVSAFTEFGVSGGVGTNGSSPAQWFTKVLAAIKADPVASRNAYMETWANFDAGQHFVPVPGDALLEDFQAYAADPFTLFASEVTGAFDRTVAAAPAQPVVHIASPADGARVASAPTTVRVRVGGTDVQSVTVEVAQGGTVVDTLDLAYDGALWWTAPWSPTSAQLDNSTYTVTATATTAAGTLDVTNEVVLGPRPTFPAGVVDDFEGYGDDTALRAEYVTYGANTISLETGSVGGGAKALRLDYDFATQTYTGVGKQLSGDWSDFNELAIWVDPDGSNNRMVLQLNAGGVAYEAYPSLAGDEPQLVTIPFVDWRPAPWDTAHADRRMSDDDLRALTSFNVYVNSAEGGAASGSLVVDDIAAHPGVEPPPLFSDVPKGHPYETEILWLHAQGLDDGYDDGTFRPARQVKRQDVARLLHAYEKAVFTPPTTPSFLDVRRSHPAYTAIEWLVAEGLVDDGRVFLPSAPLDRATAAELLWRLAGSPEPEGTEAFRDVPTWHRYRTAITWATEVGVVEPVSASTFGVLKAVQRQELARYLYRFDALPSPLEPVVLSDFADGAQGWGPLDAGPGSATASGGTLTIEAAAPDGGWFSFTPSVADWTGRTALALDVVSTTGFDTKAALQVGSTWQWCETAQAGWVSGPRTGDDALVLDLTTLYAGCGAQLADVKRVNLYLNAGTHVIDDVELR